MTKSIIINKNSITYNAPSNGSVSGVQNFTITSTGDEDVLLSEIAFPPHFEGKLVSSGVYVDSIHNVVLARSFLNGVDYFMNTDGTICLDERITGIYIGTGQPDGTLLVSIRRCLQDENGYCLTDANDNYIENVGLPSFCTIEYIEDEFDESIDDEFGDGLEDI